MLLCHPGGLGTRTVDARNFCAGAVRRPKAVRGALKGWEHPDLKLTIVVNSDDAFVNAEEGPETLHYLVKVYIVRRW